MSSSCRLYTGCHLSSKQISLRLILQVSNAHSFDNTIYLTMRTRTVHFRSPSRQPPDALVERLFPELLTTTAF